MKKEILSQHDLCWKLFLYHEKGLTEEEAMWCASDGGLQVRDTPSGMKGDIPETEAYSIGPASVAWTLWHMIYWWKNSLLSLKEGRILQMDEVLWPGTVGKALSEIHRCHDEWVSLIASLSEEELLSSEKCIWPFRGRSLADMALWLNAELMKNAAEIGSGRFLYAVKK